MLEGHLPFDDDKKIPRVTTSSGALRYIDSAAIRRGIASVRECRAISLGLPIAHGVGPIGHGRQPPQHFMRRDGADYASGGRKEKAGFGYSDDVIFLHTHGTTHVDALCHVFIDGTMFGDISASEVTSAGARQLGAETVPAIATRALVVDAVPSHRAWLDSGEVITVGIIEDRLAEAGLEPEAGDALIVRTGWVAEYRAGSASNEAWPGLGSEFADWSIGHKLSIVGADNIAVEVVPSGVPGCALPLHARLLRQEGVLFLALLDLEALRGITCAALLTINPLRIVGGTASPVAPMLLL